MRRLQRAAIILKLVEELREHDSWCGETSVQKAAYFLKELMDIPLHFEFILYKHGPYSFELKEELTALRADSILELKSPNPQYGPSYFPGDMQDYVLKRFPKTVKRYESKINFVATHLGPKGVSDLERISTALFVLRTNPNLIEADRAKKIVELKPHVDLKASTEAVQELKDMIQEIKTNKEPQESTA